MKTRGGRIRGLGFKSRSKKASGSALTAAIEADIERLASPYPQLRQAPSQPKFEGVAAPGELLHFCNSSPQIQAPKFTFHSRSGDEVLSD